MVRYRRDTQVKYRRGVPKIPARGGLYIGPPLECIFGYIPFSRRWDTVRYIQRDTAGYS